MRARSLSAKAGRYKRDTQFRSSPLKPFEFQSSRELKREMLAHKFRLYPNKQEENRILHALELCRFAYNRMLEEYNDKQLSSKEMGRFLTKLKKEMLELDEVYSKCLQPERDKLYANLAALREIRKRGRKIGKLRFKSEHRFRTITYNQLGFKLLPKNEKFGFLHLQDWRHTNTIAS